MFLGQPTPALETADELMAPDTAIPEDFLREMADWFEAFVPHEAARADPLRDAGTTSSTRPLPDDQELYSVTTAMMHYARTVALANTGRS